MHTASRIRRNLRISPRSLGVRNVTPDALGDYVSITGIDMPDATPTNSHVPITVECINTAEFVLFGDDVCTENFFNGILTTVEVEVNGSVVDTQTECIRASSEEIQRYEMSFLAPNTEGPLDVTIRAKGGRSGDPAGTFNQTIDVRDDAPDPGECTRNDDCPSGFVCRNGDCVRESGGGGGGSIIDRITSFIFPCWLDPNDDCGIQGFLTWLAVAVVVAIAGGLAIKIII